MNLAGVVHSWYGRSAVVIGDPIIDIYRFGRIERIAQEAPCPIFLTERVEHRRGGADNVAANLEALGMKVTTLFPPEPWTAKVRYMVGHHQVWRSDFDADHSANMPAITAENFSDADVVVLSDYAKGVCTEALCRQVISFAKAPVVVDPKGADWTKYGDCAAVCPNARELETWHQGPMNCHIVIKRGADGIDVKKAGQKPVNYPTQARHVFDVTGAGDTVTAVVAAVLSTWKQHAGPDQIDEAFSCAARLSNLAAGVVVAEVGTSVCTHEKLFKLAADVDGCSS